MTRKRKLQKRTQYHIVPQPSWLLFRNGKIVGRFDNKQGALYCAVRNARAMFRAGKFASIRIHNRKGRITNERTYGRDPYPPKG